MGIAAACVLEYSLWRLNNIKGNMDENEARDLYTPDQLVAMGENSPLYRYQL